MTTFYNTLVTMMLRHWDFLRIPDQIGFWIWGKIREAIESLTRQLPVGHVRSLKVTTLVHTTRKQAEQTEINNSPSKKQKTKQNQNHTTLLRSCREMKAQGNPLLAKLERQTGKYRQSQLTRAEAYRNLWGNQCWGMKT